MYKALADTVITVHFLWIVFLVFGALAGMRWKHVKYVHLAGLLYAVIIQTSHSICPLTDLESWFETRGGLVNYSGSFIVHYLDKVVYLQSGAVVVLTWILCAFNVFLYLGAPFLKKRFRLPGSPAGS